MIWVVVCAVVLALVAWSRFRPDPVVLAEKGDLGPALEALGKAAEPTEYHRVIKRLWDGYHRQEAAKVARVYLERHKDAPTAHYWIKRVLQDEPDIAAEYLDTTFLDAFYDPGVACKCGTYG